jgi:hypothetical protein
VFHFELRQFPHVARAYNRERAELDTVILRPWVAGGPVEWGGRSWEPRKAKLAVYEGPRLAVEQLGMSRGWGNATKTGEDVTERVLDEVRQDIESPPQLAVLKDGIVARAGRAPVGMPQLLELASQLAPEVDANQSVSLVARAVWELLREGRLALAPAPPSDGDWDGDGGRQREEPEGP